MSFFRSRGWIAGRRIVLVAIILFFAYRNYGDALFGRFAPPGPETEIVLTHTEFRVDLEGDMRPAWFIGLRNDSPHTTYENVVLEAIYSDADQVLERDQIVIEQRLRPGQEELIGSRDAKIREGATDGSLRVLGARVVE